MATIQWRHGYIVMCGSSLMNSTMYQIKLIYIRFKKISQSYHHITSVGTVRMN